MIDDDEIEHRPRAPRPRCLTVPLPTTVVEALVDIAERMQMTPQDLARELLTRWACRQHGPRVPEVQP